jgi:hypothetical protein
MNSSPRAPCRNLYVTARAPTPAGPLAVAWPKEAWLNRARVCGGALPSVSTIKPSAHRAVFHELRRCRLAPLTNRFLFIARFEEDAANDNPPCLLCPCGDTGRGFRLRVPPMVPVIVLAPFVDEIHGQRGSESQVRLVRHHLLHRPLSSSHPSPTPATG